MSDARVDFTRGAAERIARAVRVVEQGERDQTGPRYGRVLESTGGGGSPNRLCKTTTAFLKNTVQTLNVWEDGDPPNEEQTADETVADVVNKFADIPACSFVSVAKHQNGRWYVVAWEC